MNYLNNLSRQFTIQQLSEKLSIPKPTLRFWEKELDGIIVPLRTPGGQRRYTEEHIAILKDIKKMRNSGKSISDIKDQLENGFENTTIRDYQDINLLSERIAEVVKLEISKFMKTKSIDS